MRRTALPVSAGWWRRDTGRNVNSPPVRSGLVTARPPPCAGYMTRQEMASVGRRPASPLSRLDWAHPRPRLSPAVRPAPPSAFAGGSSRGVRPAPSLFLLLCFGPPPVAPVTPRLPVAGAARHASPRPSPPASASAPGLASLPRSPLRALCAAHLRVGAPLPLPLVRRMSCTAGSRSFGSCGRRPVSRAPAGDSNRSFAAVVFPVRAGKTSELTGCGLRAHRLAQNRGLRRLWLFGQSPACPALGWRPVPP